jgi:hypothetical protein
VTADDCAVNFVHPSALNRPYWFLITSKMARGTAVSRALSNQARRSIFQQPA